MFKYLNTTGKYHVDHIDAQETLYKYNITHKVQRYVFCLHNARVYPLPMMMMIMAVFQIKKCCSIYIYN